MQPEESSRTANVCPITPPFCLHLREPLEVKFSICVAVQMHVFFERSQLVHRKRLIVALSLAAILAPKNTMHSHSSRASE